jgi:hypothetical protein
MQVINIIVKKPPKDISDKLSKEISKVKFSFQNSNLRKSDESLEKIADDLKEKYDIWKKKTKALRQKLIENNDLLEGVTESVDFPFEGASNIRTNYVSGIARIFKAVFNKAMFSDPNIFSAVSKSENISKEELTKIEEINNYSFHTKSNGLNILRKGIIPCFRDGTLIISGYWERQIERAYDYKNYTSAEDFIRDYPTAEDAGIEQEEYDKIMDSFIIDPETEVNVSYYYDFVKYEGPRYEIIPLAKFIFYPFHATEMSELEMYGSEYYLSESELTEKAKRGEFYQKKVNELLEQKENVKDVWSASRNFIEGLAARVEGKEKEPYLIVDCVYKTDLDGDGIREKYFVTFNPTFKKILSFKPYLFRRNIDFCVPFKFVSRDNRFLGVSLLSENYNNFIEIDTLHRNRNNIRTLVTSPIMLANKSLKDDLDFWADKNLIRPGVTFWVNDINSGVKQLVLQNLDQPGNSLDEENLLNRYIELSIGASQGLSGKSTPEDPRSPMGKTIALLQQANQRIEDYITEFATSVPELANLNFSLLSQYSNEEIKYHIEQNGELVTKSIDKNLLTKDIYWYSKKRSLTLSPEFSMQRIGGLFQLYMQMYKLIMMGDEKVIDLWNRMVKVSGEPDSEKLMVKPKSNVPINQQGQNIMALLQGQAQQPMPGAVTPGQVRT